jgi:hypothetical protein
MINQLLDASIKELPGVFRNKVQNDFLQTIIFDEQIAQPLRNVPKIVLAASAINPGIY